MKTTTLIATVFVSSLLSISPLLLAEGGANKEFAHNEAKVAPASSTESKDSAKKSLRDDEEPLERGEGVDRKLLTIKDLDFLPKDKIDPFAGGDGSAYAWIHEVTTYQYYTEDYKWIDRDKVDHSKPHYLLKITFDVFDLEITDKNYFKELYKEMYKELVCVYVYDVKNKVYHLDEGQNSRIEHIINQKTPEQLEALKKAQQEKEKRDLLWQERCFKYAKKQVSVDDMLLWIKETNPSIWWHYYFEENIQSRNDYYVEEKNLKNRLPRYFVVCVKVVWLNEKTYRDVGVLRKCLLYRYDKKKNAYIHEYSSKLEYIGQGDIEQGEVIQFLKLPLKPDDFKNKLTDEASIYEPLKPRFSSQHDEEGGATPSAS